MAWQLRGTAAMTGDHAPLVRSNALWTGYNNGRWNWYVVRIPCYNYVQVRWARSDWLNDCWSMLIPCLDSTFIFLACFCSFMIRLFLAMDSRSWAWQSSLVACPGLPFGASTVSYSYGCLLRHNSMSKAAFKCSKKCTYDNILYDTCSISCRLMSGFHLIADIWLVPTLWSYIYARGYSSSRWTWWLQHRNPTWRI